MEGEAASGEREEEEALRTRSEGDELGLAECAWVRPQSARRGPGRPWRGRLDLQVWE